MTTLLTAHSAPLWCYFIVGPNIFLTILVSNTLKTMFVP